MNSGLNNPVFVDFSRNSNLNDNIRVTNNSYKIFNILFIDIKVESQAPISSVRTIIGGFNNRRFVKDNQGLTCLTSKTTNGNIMIPVGCFATQDANIIIDAQRNTNWYDAYISGITLLA